MNCFEHTTTPAVGICVKCYKGLCRSCAIDLKYGISCNEHQQDVTTIDKLINNNSKISSMQSKKWYLMPLFFIVFGLIMEMNSTSDPFRNFYTLSAFLMGLCFILFGLLLLRVNYKTFKTNKDK